MKVFHLRWQFYLIVVFLKQSVLFKKTVLPKSPLLYSFFTLIQSASLTLLYFLFLMLRLSFTFLFWCFLMSSRACIFVSFVSSFRAFYFFFTMVFCIFFVSLIYLFSCSKVTTVLLSRWCLGFHCAQFAPSLLSSLLSLSHRSHHHRFLHAQGWWCFNFF